MPGDDFLIRLKLTKRVAAASKANAEVLHFGKKSERAAIQKMIEEVKAGFDNDSQ